MKSDDLLLVAGNVLYVSAELSQSWKTDVLNTLLFSGLYASSKQDKFFDVERWGIDYSKAMVNAKWNRSIYRSVDVEPEKDEVVVLSELVYKKISDVLGAGPAQQFGRMLTCIEQSPAPQGILPILRKCAVSTIGGEAEDVSQSSTIVLQISLLGEEFVIHSVLIYLRTSEEIEVDFFNQGFVGGELMDKISVDVLQYSLDKKGYEKARVRENILKALPDTKDEMIIDLCSRCTVDEYENLAGIE